MCTVVFVFTAQLNIRVLHAVGRKHVVQKAVRTKEEVACAAECHNFDIAILESLRLRHHGILLPKPQILARLAKDII